MNAIERGLAKLRREQAERVMPIVGSLLDAWDGASNDERGLLERDFPHLCSLIAALHDVVEGD